MEEVSQVSVSLGPTEKTIVEACMSTMGSQFFSTALRYIIRDWGKRNGYIPAPAPLAADEPRD